MTLDACGLELTLAAEAFDAAPNAMLVVDAKGSIVSANTHTEKTFGHVALELRGRPLSTLLAPESRSAVHDELVGLAAAPRYQSLAPREVLGVHKSGAVFAIEISFGRLDTAQGPLWVLAIRDISQQRRVEERHSRDAAEARAERARLEVLLEHAPAFIVAINRQGNIEFINRTLSQHDKLDVIGASWLRYFPPERQGLMEASLEAACATGSTQTFETTTPGPDGAMLWFDSQIAPIRTDGQIVGAVLVSQDVTERKRAQQELLSVRHMALLGTMSAGIAHEINTPIQFVGDSVHFLRTAARKLLELLDILRAQRLRAEQGTPLAEVFAAVAQAEEDADLPYLREQLPAAFESCIDGLDRVATIVRSLKEFAHPSEAEMVVADLNRAIQSTLVIATGEYKYVADLETDFGELPLVVCHASEINQAVLNIVVNAAHAIADVVLASGRKGKISVRTRDLGDSVSIAISDTGGGIPESIRSRIFDPFFTTKEIGKGTGQGLAIAWASVKERHGGTLTFETKLGEGTTFVIRLPIAGKPGA